MSEQAPLPSESDRWTAALATLSLLAGLFSFYWAQRHPEFPWDGPILLLAAAGLLWAATQRHRQEPISARLAEGWGWPSLSDVPQWRQAAFWASIGTTLLLLSRLTGPPPASYQNEMLLWLSAIILFCLAVAPPVRRPREDWSLWWEVNRWPVLGLVALVLVALGLRLWNLETIPWTLGGDEGSQGLEARAVLRGQITNPFSTGWLGVPTMSFFFNSLSLALLGETITALRLPWAILGTATVLTTFWLVTRLRGLTLGLMTAALLATYHYHIHFSRLGSNQIADPLFVSLGLLYLYRARDRGSPLDWALAGITVGVAQYFYAGARLSIIVVFASLFWFFWTDRNRRDSLRDLVGGGLTTFGALMITGAPMFQYALRFPNEYNARLNQVGILQNGWLEQEPAVLGVSTLEVLWDQFLRSFLSFNVFPDRTVWYGSPEPLMDSLWGALFLVGLLYSTIRLVFPNADQRFFPMVVWWWSGMILGGMLTESPPSSQRLIVLAPPAVFFVAVVLLRLVQFAMEVLGRRDMKEIAVPLIAGVAILSYTSLQWYFVEYTHLNLYGSRNGEIATALGKYLASELEANERVVLLGPPHLYLGFGSIPYLEPRAEQGIDVQEPISAPPSAESLGLAPGQEPLFVAISLRENELGWVEASFPGGQRETIRDSRGETLFTVYEP